MKKNFILKLKNYYGGQLIYNQMNTCNFKLYQPYNYEKYTKNFILNYILCLRKLEIPEDIIINIFKYISFKKEYSVETLKPDLPNELIITSICPYQKQILMLSSSNDLKSYILSYDKSKISILKIKHLETNTSFLRDIDIDQNSHILYCSDPVHHIIYGINLKTYDMKIIVGNYEHHGDLNHEYGSLSLISTPIKIKLDRTNNYLYFYDSGNKKIKRINIKNGKNSVQTVISSYLGGRHYFYYNLFGISDFCFDNQNNLIFSEPVKNQITRILNGDIDIIYNNNDGFVDGKLDTSRFKLIRCMHMDSKNNLYIGDDDSFIKVIYRNKRVETIAGTYNYLPINTKDGLGKEAIFKKIKDLFIDSNENIFVLDETNIRKLSYKFNIF